MFCVGTGHSRVPKSEKFQLIKFAASFHSLGNILMTFEMFCSPKRNDTQCNV